MAQIVLINQFGEESINQVQSAGTDVVFTPSAQAANTVLANITGSSAVPTAVTYAQLAPKLPCTQLLTGLAAGTDAAIASTDTLLVALAKLQAQIDALQP